MSDIFHEVDEELERDKIESLWARYQTPIFVLAVLIVAATGAWSYYSTQRAKEAEAANARYAAAAALADAGKGADAYAAFDAMAKSAPKGYASLARLRAALALGATDKAKAIQALDALAEDKTVDRLTQEVAQLRGALLTADDADREKMMNKLGPLMTSDGAFRFTAQEWTGLDALANEDYDEAERVFNLLQNDRNAPQSTRQRASIYQGLLHAARGAKTPAGVITSITPVIEPADGSDASGAPAVTQEPK